VKEERKGERKEGRKEGKKGEHRALRKEGRKGCTFIMLPGPRDSALQNFRLKGGNVFSTIDQTSKAEALKTRPKSPLRTYSGTKEQARPVSKCAKRKASKQVRGQGQSESGQYKKTRPVSDAQRKRPGTKKVFQYKRRGASKKSVQ
jgi:hypothetical protein